MVTIRKASREDAQAIFDLRKKAILHQCPDRYPIELLTVWTDGAPSETFRVMVEEGFHVAVIDDVIVATGMINTDDGMVDAIFVDPSHMGQGVGQFMLKHLEAIAITSGLGEMKLDSTLNAAGFYRAYGFVGEEVANYHSPKGITLACIPMQKQIG